MLTAIWLSIKVAGLSLLVIVPPGTLLAWVLARKQFVGKSLLEAICGAPLVLPPVVTGYLLLLLLGRQSLLGGFLEQAFGLRIPFSQLAAVLAAAVMSFPLLVRAARLGFELIDPGLEVAAATLGAPPWQVFWRVSLPLALPGLITGLTLAFARGLGEFGATMVLAGNIEGQTRTIPLAVYALMQSPGKDREALLLAGFSVLISVAALIVSEWHARRVAERFGRHA